MAKTVVGLFDNYNEAQTVVQELVNAGFNREDISLAANDAHGAGANLTTGTGAGSDAGHGAAKGAGTGAAIGGIAGLLIGLGALTIPGIGPVLAAGPLAASLGTAAGATVTGAAIGAVGGGLIGGLTHMGVPREQAEYYAEGVRRGGTLVAVSSPDNMVDRAVDIMNGNGAVDIDERAGYYRQNGFTGFSESAAPYTTDQITRERDLYRTQPAGTFTDTTAATRTGTTGTARNQGEQVIPVVEEELAVGKRQVQRGGARIHTVVQERPVEEQVTLREEHVTVDRRPVDRPATDADMAFREGTIEVTETAEQPVVSKQAHVVEEVVIGKEATERTETVRDTVRRTDVEVENLDSRTTGRAMGTVNRSDLDPMTDDDDTLAADRTTVGTTTRGMAGDVDRTLPGNRVPGVQTGGRDADGSPDTRGITEKVADTVTGDNIDDKTGKPVR